MNFSKRISVALAALVLVVLGGASSAFAAATVAWDISTAPTFVANTGRSEVMGQVTLTANINCFGTGDGNCIPVAGTIQVLYQGTPIDNGIATSGIGTLQTNGIEVCEQIAPAPIVCNGVGQYITGPFTVTNTTAGGVVSFGVVTPAVGFDLAAGDQLVIRGARGQIDLGPGNVVGTAILGQLTASPSTIAGFQPTQEVVARSADPLTMAFSAWTVLQCLPTVGTGTVTVTEGFNTAFVDSFNGVTLAVTDPADTGGATANPRPLFGGNRNSRINIQLTGLPTGVTLTWPGASAADSGGGATGASLIRVSQSAKGDNALYTYHSPNQAISDINGEKFVITLTAAANVALSGTSADFGTSTGQGQMYDPASPTSSRPRYNHPLEPVPGATFLTVAPCTTNLLYPWVLNFAGYDTGVSIANTSADPYGTIPQTGTCSVNLYPTDKTTTNGVSAGGAITITTAAVQPGSVWRASMSGVSSFAGQAGYIIAICAFQYGHGFAYITDNFGVGAPNTAQGYLANIIPDPKITTVGCPAGRTATNVGLNCFQQAPVGEGLGQ